MGFFDKVKRAPNIVKDNVVAGCVGSGLALVGTGIAVYLGGPITSLILVPSAVALSVAAKMIIDLSSNSREKNDVDADVKNVLELITSATSNESFNLTLDRENSNALIQCLIKWSDDEANKDKTIYLSEINIKNERLSSENCSALISLQNLSDRLNVISIEGQNRMPALTSQINNLAGKQKLRSLKQLSLPNCGLSFNDLPNISKIGKNAMLEKLDLSKNMFSSLSQNPQLWDLFANEFYKNFPLIQNVNLSACSLEDKNTAKLIPLFSQISAMKSLDLTNNNIYESGLLRIVESEEFQSNLSFKTLKHDLARSSKVNSAIEKRKRAVEKFMKSSGVHECGHIPYEIVKGIIESNSRIINALDKHIESTISSKGRQKQVKLQWRLWANECNRVRNWKRFTYEFYKEALQKGKVVVPTEMALSVKEITKVLKACKTGQKIDFTINEKGNNTLKFGDIGEKLLAAFKKIKSSRKSPILKKVDLNHLGINDDQFSELLEKDIGEYQTESLNLSHNALTSVALKDWFGSEPCPFKDVKYLDLSGNQIKADALPALLSYCRNNKVEYLNLSNNPLGADLHNQNLLGNMLKEFGRLPYLKKLDLSNIKIAPAASEVLAPLLTTPCDLETLNITQEKFNARTMINLLNRSGFRNNLGIQKIETGYNDAKSIEHILGSMNKLQDIYNGSVSKIEKTRPFMYVILDRFLMNLENPKIPEGLKTALESKDKHDSTSSWEAYHNLAEMMAYRGIKPGFTIDQFASFLENMPKSADMKTDRYSAVIRNAKNAQRIELNVDLNEHNVEKAFVLSSLSNAFLKLENQEPVIHKIALKNLSLNDDELNTLIDVNMLCYNVETLDLSNNQLTDETLQCFKDIIDDLKHLKYLDLSNNKFTAKGILDFVEASQHLNLETIILDNNKLVVDQVSHNALSELAKSAHLYMPALKKISLQNTVDNIQSFALFKPLLNQSSLLNEIKIAQTSIKRAALYRNILKEALFKGNLSVGQVDTGRNHTKMIQNELGARDKDWQQMETGLPKAPRASGRVCRLLDAYIKNQTETFPDTVKLWSRTMNETTSGAFMASPEDKFRFMANQVKYFRNRATLLGAKPNPQVLDEEYLALKRNELHKYWRLSNNKPNDSTQLRDIQASYHAQISQYAECKALLMVRFNLQNMQFSVYWGEDDAIRVVNNVTQKQFVFHRYEKALSLNLNQEVTYKVGEISLKLNGAGNIKISLNRTIIAQVDGSEARLANDHAMTHNVNTRQYECVERLSDVLGDSVTPVNTPPVHVPQYQQQRACRQSVPDSTNANTRQSRYPLRISPGR